MSKTFNSTPYEVKHVALRDILATDQAINVSFAEAGWINNSSEGVMDAMEKMSRLRDICQIWNVVDVGKYILAPVKISWTERQKPMHGIRLVGNRIGSVN